MAGAAPKTDQGARPGPALPLGKGGGGGLSRAPQGARAQRGGPGEGRGAAGVDWTMARGGGWCAMGACERRKLVIHLVIWSHPMQSWPVQDAKARFSEFLETCLSDGPQMVTKRGAEAAVLVPVTEWRRLQASARPGLKQLLLAEPALGELPIPPRGAARRRPPTDLG